MVGNESTFCATFPKSVVCRGPGPAQNDKDLFVETHRVVGKSNRLVLYPKDLLHKAWVGPRQHKQKGSASPVSLPCSAKEGRLAISLFFLSTAGSPIVETIGNEWGKGVTKILQSKKNTENLHLFEQRNNNGGYTLPPTFTKPFCLCH